MALKTKLVYAQIEGLINRMIKAANKANFEEEDYSEKRYLDGRADALEELKEAIWGKEDYEEKKEMENTLN